MKRISPHPPRIWGLILVFLLSPTPSWGQGTCTDIRLDRGGRSMSRIPVKDQGSDGLCYAYAASQAMDAYLNTLEPKRNETISPLGTAMALAIEREQDLVENPITDGGWGCEAIDAVSHLGACTENSKILHPRTSIADFTHGLLRVYERFHNQRSLLNRATPLDERLAREGKYIEKQIYSQLTGSPGPQRLTGDKLVKAPHWDGHPLMNFKNSSSPGLSVLEEELKGLLNGETSAATQAMKHRIQKEATEWGKICYQQHGVPSKDIPQIEELQFYLSQQDPTRFLKFILNRGCQRRPARIPRCHPLKLPLGTGRFVGKAKKKVNALLQKKNAQPILIGYCYGAVTGAVENWRQAIPKECIRHESLIIGQRKGPQGSCQYLVRNSMGVEKKRTLRNGRVEIEGGNFWIDSDLLLNSTFRLATLKAPKTQR